MRIFYILAWPMFVYAVNGILDARGLYYALPWVDMPMHFLGGASIGLAGIGFLSLFKQRGFVNEPPFLLQAFFIISFVGLAAVSWELWEFSMDIVFARHLHTDLFDTMVDMFLGLLGGLAAVLVWLAVLSISRRIR